MCLKKLHPWSDVVDALQYVCLVTGNMGAYEWVLRQVVSRTRKPFVRPRISSLAWTRGQASLWMLGPDAIPDPKLTEEDE